MVDNIVRVSGGGANECCDETPTTISSTLASFGISPGGATTALSSTQAGAHADITGSIAFNTINLKGSLAGDPKEFVDELPSGFAGDLVDTPTCPPARFSLEECPIDTQIGVTTITTVISATEVPFSYTEAVYNLSPNPGEVAKFGFTVAGNFNIQGNVSVSPGSYKLRVAFHNIDDYISEVDRATLTIWGVPAAAIHNPWRWKPEIEHSNSHFGVASEVAPVPYSTNPTSCEGSLNGVPLNAVLSELTSWQNPNLSESLPADQHVRSVRSWDATS